MSGYEDEYDDGTMVNNVQTLSDALVGHKIVKAERDVPVSDSAYWYSGTASLLLTLDNGKRVILRDTSDCCAYTDLENVIEHLPTINHAITNVTADDGFNTWHIFADAGEVMQLEVAWSPGNPFYYGYGFDIQVVDAPVEDVAGRIQRLTR